MRKFRKATKWVKVLENAIAEIIVSAEFIPVIVALFLGLLYGPWQWVAVLLN